MSKSPNRKSLLSWRRRHPHADTIILVTLAVALLVYSQIIQPNVYAARYESRMIAVSNNMQSCAGNLSDTSKLPLFSAPDVSLDDKLSSISSMRAAIKRCSDDLQIFNRQAQSLQELKLSGFTPRYHSARTIRAHALDVTGQSSDIINNYLELANFLDDYFQLLKPFVTYTTDLRDNNDANILKNRIDDLATQGENLHQQAATMRKLKAPVGFENITQPTALMLDEAADGFDNLAIGYQNGSDVVVKAGFNDIEQAVAQYDNTVKNLPFDALSKSYTAKQANGLGVKFNDLKAVVAY